MEHILQFGINIDDNRIIQLCEEKAVQSVMNEVEKKANRRSGWDDTYLENLFAESVKKVVEEHKDEIIEKAVKKAVERFTSSKKFKEMMGEVGK